MLPTVVAYVVDIKERARKEVRANWIRMVSVSLPPRARALYIVWGAGGLGYRKSPSLCVIYGSDGERGYDAHVGQSMVYELAGITHMVNDINPSYTISSRIQLGDHPPTSTASRARGY